MRKPSIPVDRGPYDAEAQRFATSVAYLRSLPIGERVGAIIVMHSWCLREFAQLVLEYTDPDKLKPPRKRKRKRKASRR